MKTSILVMGMSGIIAQIILLREILIISIGNELIIGIVLSNWLLFEALGSWLFGRFNPSLTPKYIFHNQDVSIQAGFVSRIQGIW